jgi:quercetin dioxygenase-like cupin family protein
LPRESSSGSLERLPRQSNFVGNPTQMDAKAVRTLRLKFPAGSRSNWHSHSHSQMLMVEEGRRG